MPRPRIALSMLDGLLGYAFTPEHLERLGAVGEIVDPVPLASFEDDRAAAVLAETEVLLGHWGCPTLTAEVSANSYLLPPTEGLTAGATVAGPTASGTSAAPAASATPAPSAPATTTTATITGAAR